MTQREIILLLAIGAAIWILGTVYYARLGALILETTPARYWIAFAVSPVVSAILCVAIMRWMHVPHIHWASAMLLLAIPGMIGEAIALSHFGTFMPKLQAASGGRYGAFLFATYAVVLGIGEAVALVSD
jgi:hypothetical protein